MTPIGVVGVGGGGSGSDAPEAAGGEDDDDEQEEDYEAEGDDRDDDDAETEVAEAKAAAVARLEAKAARLRDELANDVLAWGALDGPRRPLLPSGEEETRSDPDVPHRHLDRCWRGARSTGRSTSC